MEILNCTWKFQFQCPLYWDKLRATDDPNVRACDSCLENVYLCDDEQEVARRASAGQCVSLGFYRRHGAELIGRVIDKG